jgi:hypothetical protein
MPSRKENFAKQKTPGTPTKETRVPEAMPREEMKSRPEV